MDIICFSILFLVVGYAIMYTHHMNKDEWAIWHWLYVLPTTSLLILKYFGVI